MTLQHGLHAIIPIHIWPDISQSKCNQTMKFGQLTEHKKRNFFSSKMKNAENEGGWHKWTSG